MLQTIESIDQFNTNEMLPPQNTPTSPQSNNLFGNDAFGSTPATPVAATNNLSDDLSSLSMGNNMPTENPPPVPNNTMSKEQILSAFNTPGAQQQQQQMFMQQQMPQQQMMQNSMMTSPNMNMTSQPGMMMSNPFGLQQANAMPQIPPRVQPQIVATQQQPGNQMVANNNQVFGATMMSPAPKPTPAQQGQQKPANDPFSDLGQLGGGGGFQSGGNPGIDNYLNAKGVVPVQQPQVAQQQATQVQQGGGLMQPQMTPQAAPRQQPAANNFDSLFG